MDPPIKCVEGSFTIPKFFGISIEADYNAITEQRSRNGFRKLGLGGFPKLPTGEVGTMIENDFYCGVGSPVYIFRLYQSPPNFVL
jgi:hypothetical protein